MKKLFLLCIGAAVLLVAAVSCRNKINPDGDASRFVLTRPAEDVTFNSASLSGHLLAEGQTVSQTGFVYDRLGDLDEANSPREIAAGYENEFSLILENLDSDADYEFVAYAVIDGKEEFGKHESFRTLPAVFTGEAQNVGGNSAKLVGYIATTDVQDAGFILDKAGQLDFQNSPRRRNVPHSTHDISSSVTTLESDTAYEYAAYVKINDVEKYGDVVRFSTSAVPVTSLTLDKTSALIYMEDTKSLSLTATVKPSNATLPGVIWSSDNTDVATVVSSGFQTGVVTFKGGGEVTIKAASEQSPSIYATCKITVKGVPPQNSVDMGLPSGRLWRNCNAGTSSVTGIGNYYGWGETKTRSSFLESNYTYFSQGSSGYYPWKYTSTDGRKELELSDDAARSLLGGTWRIPTFNDWHELRMNTTCKEDMQGGVKGLLFTAKNPDRKGNYNSLFFPYGGYKDGTAKKTQYGSLTIEGLYWLNAVYIVSGNYTMAQAMIMGGTVAPGGDTRQIERHFGLLVRPVCD